MHLKVNTLIMMIQIISILRAVGKYKALRSIDIIKIRDRLTSCVIHINKRYFFANICLILQILQPTQFGYEFRCSPCIFFLPRRLYFPTLCCPAVDSEVETQRA